MDHSVDTTGTVRGITTEVLGTRVFHTDPNRLIELTTGDGDTVTAISIKEQQPDGSWLTAAMIHLGNRDTADLALGVAAHAAKAGGISW